eukprot:4846249-Pleurochrysis_carterae.AAC.3
MNCIVTTGQTIKAVTDARLRVHQDRRRRAAPVVISTPLRHPLTRVAQQSIHHRAPLGALTGNGHAPDSHPHEREAFLPQLASSSQSSCASTRAARWRTTLPETAFSQLRWQTFRRTRLP